MAQSLLKLFTIMTALEIHRFFLFVDLKTANGEGELLFKLKYAELSYSCPRKKTLHFQVCFKRGSSLYFLTAQKLCPNFFPKSSLG
jgi:hypothetical protein